MGRWWKSGQISKVGLACKASLAAGSVAALLMVVACGDKDADKAAAGNNAVETVETAAIDPAQAPIIQKAIEDYLQLMEGPEGQRVIHHGTVKVTPGSDAFDVAIDGIYIGAEHDDRLDVGTVSYRLTPKSSDGYIASDLKHAATMSKKGKDGKEDGQLALVTKTFTADWSTSLQTFLAMDWQLADINAKDSTPGAGDFSTATAAVSIASTEKGNGVIDQTVTLDLAKLAAKSTAGESFTLGKLTVKGAMTGLKVKEYMAKSREMQAVMAEIAEAQRKAAVAAEAAAAAQTDSVVPTPTAAITPEQQKKLGDAMKGMAGLLSGLVYDVDLADIGFKNKDGSEPFRLAKGSFDMGFTGLDAEKGSFSLGLGHEGLVINDPQFTASPIYAKLLPTAGNLAVKLDDVPSKEFWALVGDNFPSLMTTDPTQSEAAASVMFVAMQQLLQKAPMKLTVAPSGIVSEALQLDATGAFDVKPEAAFGLVGALDVNLHGLDEAVKLANEAAQTSPDAAQVVGGLAMIQSMAKRETGSDGKPVDKLKLEVDAAGDAKVNGMSLSGM